MRKSTISAIVRRGRFELRMAGSSDVTTTDTITGTIDGGIGVLLDSAGDKYASLRLLDAAAGEQAPSNGSDMTLYLPVPGKRLRELAVAIASAGRLYSLRVKLALQPAGLRVSVIEPDDSVYLLEGADVYEDLFDEDVLAQANGVIVGDVDVDFDTK